MLVDRRAVDSGSLVRAATSWWPCVSAVRTNLQKNIDSDMLRPYAEDPAIGLDIDFNRLFEMTKWLHLIVAALDQPRRNYRGGKRVN